MRVVAKETGKVELQVREAAALLEGLEPGARVLSPLNDAILMSIAISLKRLADNGPAQPSRR